MPLTAPAERFDDRLAGRVGMPLALAPLGHYVTAEAPRGIVIGAMIPNASRTGGPAMVPRPKLQRKTGSAQALETPLEGEDSGPAVADPPLSPSPVETRLAAVEPETQLATPAQPLTEVGARELMPTASIALARSVQASSAMIPAPDAPPATLKPRLTLGQSRRLGLGPPLSRMPEPTGRIDPAPIESEVAAAPHGEPAEPTQPGPVSTPAAVQPPVQRSAQLPPNREPAAADLPLARPVPARPAPEPLESGGTLQRSPESRDAPVAALADTASEPEERQHVVTANAAPEVRETAPLIGIPPDRPEPPVEADLEADPTLAEPAAPWNVMRAAAYAPLEPHDPGARRLTSMPMETPPSSWAGVQAGSAEEDEGRSPTIASSPAPLAPPAPATRVQGAAHPYPGDSTLELAPVSAPASAMTVQALGFDPSGTPSTRGEGPAADVNLPAAEWSLVSRSAEPRVAHPLTHLAQQPRLASAQPAEHSVTAQRLRAEALVVEPSWRAANDMPLAVSPPAAASRDRAAEAASPAVMRQVTEQMVALGQATQESGGSLVFNPPPGVSTSPGPAVQRATVSSPTVIAAGEGAAATANTQDAEMEELARKLYSRIRSRLWNELLVDRERAGLLTDLR